jgi:FkbM family methyltransferase
VRALIKRILHRYGYDLNRFCAQNGRPIDVVRLAVEWRLQKEPELLVVQIGANDGRMDDPVFDVIGKHRLPALLVEPLPDAFRQLQAHYASQPQVAFENCAISDQNGEREFYRVRDGVYANPRVRGMAGFYRENLLRAKGILPGLQQHIEVLKVPTMTMEGLLAKHGVRQIGLLQLDTEGYDHEVIKLTLQTGMVPSLIHYEHVHLSARQQLDCRDYLSGFDYRFATNGHNTLALRGD